MPFPTLNRYHVAMQTTFQKRRLRHVTNPPTTTTTTTTTITNNHTTQKNVSCASPSSCHPPSRTESLRSTWMTDDSDAIVESDATCDQLQSTRGSNKALPLVGPPPCPQRPLSDWVYWQRDAVALPDCWTRVFAVFWDNVLWLYRYEDASAKSLLVRICVTALDLGEDARQLQFQDGRTTVSVQLCLPDAPAFYRWHCHVTRAVAAFPVVKREVNATMVSTMTSAMQKKSFWREMATAVLQGNKYRCGGSHEENGIVLCNRPSRKSVGQRWKNVTTVLKSALTPDHQFS